AGVGKILDLGLVRSMLEPGDHLTKTHDARHILGTLDYLSPEQVRQTSDIDGRSDIYSLGATFFFLLTGQPPFGKVIVAQKLCCHLIEDPVPVGNLRPEVSREVEEVVLRMLAKDPAQRYQTAREVAEALAAWAVPGSLPAGPGVALPAKHLAPVARRTR